MKQPIFSLIIPVYNVEPFIRRCLDSILCQSYESWEALLIDDGSPDNSGAICEEYSKRDSRFRVFHKENGGVSSARNLGLDNANGEWVWYIDSDDFICPKSLVTLYHYIQKYDTDTVLFGMQDQNIEGIAIGCDSRAFKYGDINNVIETADYGPPTVLHKRAILENHGLRFTEGIRMSEDIELQYKFLFLCKKAIQIPDILYFVQRHEGSATQNPNAIQNAADDIPIVLSNLVGFIKQYNIKEENWIACRINRLFKSMMSMNAFAKSKGIKQLQLNIKNADEQLHTLNFKKYKDLAVRVGCFDIRLYFLIIKLRKLFQ